MIVVLEGPTGAGKSSIARGLANRINWPIYRPFRSDPRNHNPGSQDDRLQLLPDFKINTWREDLYTADLCAVLRPNMIFDRSMPSGVAYALEEMSELQRQTAVQLWAERMKLASAVIIYADAESHVRSLRGSRQGDWEKHHIFDACQRAFQAGVPMWIMDTMLPVAALVDAIQGSIVDHDGETRHFLKRCTIARSPTGVL